MKKLRDDDYLLEITIRVSVRRNYAAAVISLTERHDEDDETEEDRILTAVLDLVDSRLLEHDPLLQYAGAAVWRVPTVKHFEDFQTLGELSHRTRLHKKTTEIESVLTKKRNKGRKISLDTADRLFAGLQERLNRLPDHEEFGVAVPLVLLFGSYLGREPEVGDIDLAVMTMPKPNHEIRRKQLNKARRSGVSLLEELIGPEKEVLQFLKNRSAWLALHDFSEALSLKDLSFKVVHYTSEFQPLVDRLQRRALTGQEFLKVVEKLRMELHAQAMKQS
jgi:predicted nucleotidyltransferase